MKGKVLIAGVGNIFLGDDAFGVEVLRCLASRELPEHIRIKDFGIRGFDLAYALAEQWELVILVDATQRGGSPGTLYTIEHDPGGKEKNTQASLDSHGMHPIRALDLICALGAEVPRTVVIGCEPEDLGGDEGRMGLSSSVAGTVEQAAEMAIRIASSSLPATAT